MNILDMLYKELKEKSHLSLDDKKRFLYLRMCQIFTYDTRYHYLNLLGDAGKRLRAEILGRRINLENVDDFRVSCATFSPAYQDALKELLNVDSTILGDGHRWVELESDGQIIKADGTLGDLTRAKFEIRTRGYGPYKRNDWFQETLENRDIKVNYIRPFYENISNLLLNGAKALNYRNNYELDCEFDIDDVDARERYIFDKVSDDIFGNLFWEMFNFDSFASQLFSNSEDFLLARNHIADCIFSEYDRIKSNEALVNLFTLKRIQSSFNEISGNIQNFEDAKFLLDYMFQCVKFANDADSFSQVDLFQNTDDSNWNFSPIYVFNFTNRSIYFTLKKENNQWLFVEISLEEVQFLASNYKGQNKDLLYR